MLQRSLRGYIGRGLFQSGNSTDTFIHTSDRRDFAIPESSLCTVRPICLSFGRFIITLGPVWSICIRSCTISNTSGSQHGTRAACQGLRMSQLRDNTSAVRGYQWWSHLIIKSKNKKMRKTTDADFQICKLSTKTGSKRRKKKGIF